MTLQKTPVKMYMQILPTVILTILFIGSSILFESATRGITILFIIAVGIVLLYHYHRVDKLFWGIVYIVGTYILLSVVFYSTLFMESIDSEFYYDLYLILLLLVLVGNFYLLYRWGKSWNSQC